VQLRIISKNGKRIDHISSCDNHSVTPEQEVLFIPRSRFVIKSKKVFEKDFHKHYEIDLEEIGPAADIPANGSRSQELMVVRGEVFAADDVDGRQTAMEECGREKNRQDITGECHLSCSPSDKGFRCRWAASDWMILNPFDEAEALDKFYKVK